MRRSLKVLLFGVAIPGALSPAIYAAWNDQHEVEVDDVRVHVRHLEPVIDVKVQVDVSPVRVDIAPISVARIVLQAANCEVRQERGLEVDARRNPTLDVAAGSGVLEVVGVEGLEEVRLSAVMCASSEELMEDLHVTLLRNGDRIKLETRYPSWEDSWNRAYARIDLVIEVPLGMAADIEDSSGAMTISGLGDLDIDDSSGEIEVTDITGNVRIDDSSGEILVRNVRGDVDIEDGSGEVEVRTVTGTVLVSDGSGSIDIRDVTEDVLIPKDGSGSIDVSKVGGEFVVDRDGSGGIRHSGVEGRVEIPERRRNR